MKRSVLRIAIFAMAVAGILLVGCKKKDSEKPVVTIVKPTNDFAVKQGDKLEFDLTLTDNVAVASYRINIHPNFGEYHHDHGVNQRVRHEVGACEPFEYNKVYTVEGKKAEVKIRESIDIPATAHDGEYHFLVQCTDASGNEQKAVVDIVIEPTGEPCE